MLILLLALTNLAAQSADHLLELAHYLRDAAVLELLVELEYLIFARYVLGQCEGAGSWMGILAVEVLWSVAIGGRLVALSLNFSTLFS